MVMCCRHDVGETDGEMYCSSDMNESNLYILTVIKILELRLEGEVKERKKILRFIMVQGTG